MIALRTLAFPSDTLHLEQMSLHVGLAAVTVADELGIYDALRDGNRSPCEIAEALHLREPGISAMCPVLVAMKMLEAGSDGTYGLTNVAMAYWLTESPLYRGRVLHYRRQEFHHRRLARVLREGGGDNPITDMWAGGSISEDAARGFTEIMHSLSLAPSIAAVRSGAFEETRHIIDAGGGSGAFCAAYVSHLNDRRATLMDLPVVCEVGKQYVARYVDTQNVDFYPCDFFRDSWPTHGDAYFFGNILHDWNEDRVRQLLASCHDALPPGGFVFIQEILLDEGRTGPPVAAYFNLMMHLTHGSKQYTALEIDSILREVGFHGSKTVHRFGDYSLIAAKRP